MLIDFPPSASVASYPPDRPPTPQSSSFRLLNCYTVEMHARSQNFPRNSEVQVHSMDPSVIAHVPSRRHGLSEHVAFPAGKYRLVTYHTLYHLGSTTDGTGATQWFVVSSLFCSVPRPRLYIHRRFLDLSPPMELFQTCIFQNLIVQLNRYRHHNRSFGLILLIYIWSEVIMKKTSLVKEDQF